MSDCDCCTGIQTILLFVFNFIIWVFGIGCLGVGIWALVDPAFVNTVNSILDTGTYSVSLSTIQASAGILVAIGAVTFIIGFCGCCGAMKKSKCLLQIYVGVMGLLLILQIVAIILMFVFSSTMDSIAVDVYNVWIKNDVRYNSTYYSSVEQQYATEVVAMNQYNGQCCGSVNGSSDYYGSVYYNDSGNTCLVPETCCKGSGSAWNAWTPENRDACCKNNPDFTNINACVVNFYSILPVPYWLFYVVAFSFLAAQILVSIFACCVYKSIDEYE